MKNIWAPWRMTYIDDESTRQGCIFCDKLKAADPRADLVLAATSHSLVMLNKYPYNSGHLLLAPKRHEKLLAGLSVEEHGDLSEALRRSVEIIMTVLRPDGVNLGMNLGRCAGAGVEDHLHWHVVPRWQGDTNFMPVVSDVRVIPQRLLESYDRLRPYFIAF